MIAPASTRLELINISKRFPGTIANDRISLRVAAGEIHSLIGENGAGKSTLMNIIYGVLGPDSGNILWDNKEVEINSPKAARELGIGMLFQHFSLLETLSVRENLLLSMPARWSKAGSAETNLDEQIKQLADQHGIEIHLDELVANLSAGQKQRVEIARCLLQKVRLLILDEPTSVLTPDEAEGLLAILRKLADNGCSILFISHKIAEIRSLCHRATVLRSGRVTGTFDPRQASAEEITRMMLGEDTLIQQQFSAGVAGRKVLELKALSAKPSSETNKSKYLKEINLNLEAGTIVGLAGVAGNGQDQLMDVISGELAVNSGSIHMNSQCITHYSVRQRRAAGISTLPVERLGRGAASALSLTENLLLTRYAPPHTTHISTSPTKPSLLINWAEMRKGADQVLRDFQVKAQSNMSSASSLSGGNLQKFLIGREIIGCSDSSDTTGSTRVLAFYNPTWGVDVGAANLIHRALIDLRDQGAAILVISEDIDELFTISDRLGALCAGQLSPILPKDRVDLSLLGSWMTGANGADLTSVGAR